MSVIGSAMSTETQIEDHEFLQEFFLKQEQLEAVFLSHTEYKQKNEILIAAAANLQPGSRDPAIEWGCKGQQPSWEKGKHLTFHDLHWV